MTESKLDTAQAARGLLIRELEGRGYKVTQGGPPRHLVAERPGVGDRFCIHVKGNRKPSPWFATEVPEHDIPVCILVVVEGTRFFIMKSSEFNGLIRLYRQEHPQQGASGFKWSDCVPFENRWDKLPA